MSNFLWYIGNFVALFGGAIIGGVIGSTIGLETAGMITGVAVLALLNTLLNPPSDMKSKSGDLD